MQEKRIHRSCGQDGHGRRVQDRANRRSREGAGRRERERDARPASAAQTRRGTRDNGRGGVPGGVCVPGDVHNRAYSGRRSARTRRHGHGTHISGHARVARRRGDAFGRSAVDGGRACGGGVGCAGPARRGDARGRGLLRSRGRQSGRVRGAVQSRLAADIAIHAERRDIPELPVHGRLGFRAVVPGGGVPRHAGRRGGVELETDIVVGKTYTIDEIKYVDVDNEIRDARMDGERTVTVGVSYAAPSATITAYAAPDRVELDVELIDAGAIERSGGDVVIAFAEEGGEPVVRKANELMVYEGLDSGVTYRYALAASYDALDGEGEVRRLLYEGSCRTQSYFALTDVFPEKRGVTFAVRPLIAGGVAECVELYDAFGLVAETTPDAPAFDGLLSGHDYTLRLVYSYGSDGDGIEEYAFTTPSVLPPEVTIAEEVIAGKASLAFDVAYSDPDGAIVSRTETLYLDGEAVGTGTSFFGLLSGRTYELRVTYTYDLNDGEGVRTATLSREGRTVALTAPSAEISERVTIGKRSLAFDVTCSDPDDTITSESFTLYLDGEAVGAGGTAYYELLSGREYEFVAEYVYDLRDGAGERVLTVRATASTTESVTPTVTLTSISAGDDEITFSLLVSDPDDTLGTILPKLYASGEQVAVTSGNRFVGLDADTLYTIVAEYVYDLHDGAGAREAEASAEVRTALHEVTLVGVTPLMDSGGAVLADENVMLDIRYSTESRIVPKSFVVNGQTCPAVVNEDGRSVVYYVPPAGADEIVVDVTDVQYTHNGVAVKSVVNSSADVAPCLLRVYRKVSPVYVLQSGDYTTSDKGELLIRLDDLGDYVMRSVSLNGETYPVRSVGDNVVAVDVSLPDTGITRFSLDSISYGDADAPVTVAAPGYMAGIAYRVTSVVDVSTADELAAAANDEAGLKAYRLTNDIDLTGVEWVSRPLTHVLDGNGHTVRGLTQIERLNGSNVQRGLFTTCDVGRFDLTL